MMILCQPLTTEIATKPHSQHSHTIEQFRQFRQQLSDLFPRRTEASMNLLDALCSNQNAASVVQLSLNPIFRYQYSSIYDSIDNAFLPENQNTVADDRPNREQQLIEMIGNQLPTPIKQPFWLIGVDATSAARPFAHTLDDRTCVYHPNPIASNKPITFGHRYSVLFCFPEKPKEHCPPWVIPLSIRRVTSDEKETTVAAQQVTALLSNKNLPCHDQLCVQVVDSTLSAVTFLGPLSPQQNLITIARVRSNRVFYRSPPRSLQRPPPGHPTWYGNRFDLKDPTTWGQPDAVEKTSLTTRRGRRLTVEIERWYNLLMRGTHEFAMHLFPFTLVRIRVKAADGKWVFQRPMWLIVIGHGRHQLSGCQTFEAYRQRYDAEHFFRFGKQRLLLNGFQTPDIEHEQNWWQMVQLAYVQLWMARPLAESLPRPWERYLPQFQSSPMASPPGVQRDFGRIIRQIEPSVAAPKRRGKSPGRVKGKRPQQRKRHKIIKKRPKHLKRVKSAA